jgi:hypothetical protein
MDIVFALSVAAVYLISVFLMNKYSSSDKKTPKQMLMDASVVFLAVIATEYSMDLTGLAGQKGRSVTAAFTQNPDF